MKSLFLPRPSAIRSALHDSIASASKLDFAVAFVGHDWQDILASARVPLRVVCWLMSTNTNPFAVRQLMSRLGTKVKQMDRMHAKVYLAHGANAAIVGSANLSISALAEDDIAGQSEAAVLVRGKNEFAPVAKWFNDMWTSARRIGKADLNNAERAWQAAHAGRGSAGQRGQAGTTARASHRAVAIPSSWTPSRMLLRLADKVRGVDLDGSAYLKGLKTCPSIAEKSGFRRASDRNHWKAKSGRVNFWTPLQSRKTVRRLEEDDC